MNFKSKAVPVVAEQFSVLSSALQPLFEKYGTMTVKEVAPNTEVSEVRFYLKPEYGSTEVVHGDWLVEFPNGEIHVVRNERFHQRFEHVDTYTPEEVKNAISMARTLAVLGGESS